MYEFSDKEARANFKKTSYGKKINKMLNISLITALVLFIASCVVYFIFDFKSEFITDVQGLWINILYGITIISIIIACYFDGKRDGAIEQFKRGNKK